jgi:PAS domain S-box-containing protein
VLNAGADDYLLEPLDARRLNARLAIAERRVAEIIESTLASERLKRLSLVARRTDNLVIITDARGHIEWVNDGFERVTQYSLEEVRGKRPGDILQGKETDPATVAHMKSRLRQGKGFDVEIINYNKSGRKYWLNIEVRPIHDNTGEVTNFMAVESDITAMKIAQEKLAHAREHEIRIGARIQESLLFGKVPEGIDGVDISALTIPSRRIDGDFYDIHKHGPHCFDVIIGDVMGKGVPAALMGAATKSEFLRATSLLISRRRSERLPEPEEIVTTVHGTVTRELEKLESFVTCCHARFELRDRRVCFVNCGHTGTLHLNAQTGEATSFQGLNLPLGVDRNEVYKQICIPVKSGDIFLFYSDGVTEARNDAGELFGDTRLIDILRNNRDKTPGELTDTLKNDVLSFSGSDTLHDDLTCIAVRIN